ncbi:MAG: HIT domain-containing protein [Candidatus Omnitrophica bacterium]|nr:HIT domain-containing protein [Candidatus Omnitrophota bacterium]
MDKLWAPWRIKYLKAAKLKGCIFCRAKKEPVKNFCILKSRHSMAILNIFPYNNGHVMVSPLKHVKDFSGLKDAQLLDLLKTVQRVKRGLSKALKPHGFNIGVNLGSQAGAGITGHLHIHIVPRWRQDTNFMPAIYNTKIISQSLAELYKRLKRC